MLFCPQNVFHSCFFEIRSYHHLHLTFVFKSFLKYRTVSLSFLFYDIDVLKSTEFAAVWVCLNVITWYQFIVYLWPLFLLKLEIRFNFNKGWEFTSQAVVDPYSCQFSPAVGNVSVLTEIWAFLSFFHPENNRAILWTSIVLFVGPLIPILKNNLLWLFLYIPYLLRI